MHLYLILYFTFKCFWHIMRLIKPLKKHEKVWEPHLYRIMEAILVLIIGYLCFLDSCEHWILPKPLDSIFRQLLSASSQQANVDGGARCMYA